MTINNLTKIGVLLISQLFFIVFLSSLKVYSASIHLSDNTIYTIDQINFKFIKTESFDKNTLLDLMNMPKKKTFSHEDLEKDMQILKKFYFDNGFFNAVVDTSSSYNEADQSINITIIILEKNRYKVKKINYSGLGTLNKILMEKIFYDPQIKPEMNYDRSSILSETNRILDILQNNGYPFVRVDTANGTIIEKSPGEDYVNIEISFLNADKQYYFGKTRVSIAKNTYKLTDDLILRELDYKEGDLYNRDHIIQSERNFNNFSIILSGRVQVDSILEGESRINYVVNISLNNKYELTPSIFGTDIDNQFFVGAGLDYSDKNFFGGGRVFSIGINGYLHSVPINLIELKAYIFQPYFLTNTATAKYDVRFGIYNFTKNLQFFLLRNLFQVIFTLPTYTFYNSVFTDLTGDLVREKSDSTSPATISNLMNSVIGVTLIHDNTNDLFNPSAGFYHNITVENGGLLPKFITVFNPNLDYSQYVKLLTLNKFYSDLYGRKNSIAATFIRIGDIIEYGRGSNIVPVAPIYKFFSGGGSSVRGWLARENGFVANPAFGGDFIFEGSFEYRWRTYAENENFLKNLWTVYFFDYGSIWDKAKYFRFNEISLAVGFGIRYNTFVGPLRLDFGFKLYDPKALPDRRWLFDKKGQIYGNKFSLQFGLGNAF
jgi:outer membrane protein insertion porin family